MRTTILIVVTLFLLVSISGCHKTSKIEAQLNRADSIMMVNPDSAFSIILEIDTAQLKSRQDKALYCLLLTQACDKLYFEFTTDSIIKIATEYYAESDDTRHKMLAYYYHGLINYYTKNYSNSIFNLLNAETAATSVDDKFYLGMIYRSMSDIYSEMLNAPQQLKYARLAYQYFTDAKAYRHADFAKLDLGKSYLNNDSIDIAIHLIEDLSNSSGSDSVLQYKCCEVLADAYFQKQQYKKTILTMANYDNNYQESYIPYILAVSYQQLGYIDKSAQYFRLSDSLPSNKLYIGSISNTNNFSDKKLIAKLSKDVSVLDSILIALEHQQVDFIANSYAEQQYSKTAEEIRLTRQRTFYTILSLTVLIIAIAILYYKHIQLHRLKISEAISNATSIKSIFELQCKDLVAISKENATIKQELSDKEAEFSKNEEFVSQLFYEKFIEINKLCNKYYDIKGSYKEERSLYQETLKMIHSISPTKDAIHKLESYVNTYKNNLISAFKNSFPDLKEEEYLVFLYSAIGLSPKAISILIDNTIQVVYTRKSRLKTKIKDSNDNLKTAFLKALN
jgi:hypothetical protein